MCGDVGPHGADDAHVVDAVAEVGEDFTHFDAGLTHLFELERRGVGEAIEAWEGLVGVLGEGGLGVPGVYVGGATTGEDVDDVLGFDFELGLLGSEG